MRPAVHPGESTIVYAAGPTVVVIRRGEEVVLLHEHERDVTCVCYAEDGRHLLTADAGDADDAARPVLLLRDSNTFAVTSGVRRRPGLPRHAGRIVHIAAAADGTVAAAEDGVECPVSIWAIDGDTLRWVQVRIGIADDTSNARVRTCWYWLEPFRESFPMVCHMPNACPYACIHVCLYMSIHMSRSIDCGVLRRVQSVSLRMAAEPGTPIQMCFSDMRDGAVCQLAVCCERLLFLIGRSTSTGEWLAAPDEQARMHVRTRARSRAYACMAARAIGCG